MFNFSSDQTVEYEDTVDVPDPYYDFDFDPTAMVMLVDFDPCFGCTCENCSKCSEYRD